MELSDGSNCDDMWTPYKELLAIVESNLGKSNGAPYASFETALRKHRATFLSLLSHPPKHAERREQIKRGIKEGVTLPSVGHTVLSKELVDEAIVISDMYDLNEYLAIELLHTAQRQMPRHPGLPRGLVAVLLYYDGRKAIVTALKALVVARRGVSWCTEAADDVVEHVTVYTNRLFADGLIEKAIEKLETLDLSAELELLQRNRALGGPRHQRQIVDLFEDIRVTLAQTVMSCAAQGGITHAAALALSRRFGPRSAAARGASAPGAPSAASGAPDGPTLALQMALLYALDVSVLHRRQDGEELAQTLPPVTDSTFIPALIVELSPMAGSSNSQGTRALFQLALGLCLAALKRAPQSVYRNLQPLDSEILDQDESFVDAAIDGNVFEYLQETVLISEEIHKHEFYMRRIHTLITDFIVLMHSKLMDLRLKADEAARAHQLYAAEGLARPSADGEPSGPSRRHFEWLLRCVDRLYETDPHNLRAEYWTSIDQQHAHSHRAGGRSVTLFKFVRLAGELLAPPLLAPYLGALASLAVPTHTFSLLARVRDCTPSPAIPTAAAAVVSWDHLFSAMCKYYRQLRQEAPPSLEYASMVGAGVTPRAKFLVRNEEVTALSAALRVIRAVSAVDPVARSALVEHPHWDSVNVMFGLISCHIPITLKAELLSTLGEIGSGPETAPRVWAAMEAAQLVRTVPSISPYRTQGLDTELEEVESRNEEYPLSLAYIGALGNLWKGGGTAAARSLGAGSRAGGLDPYVDHAARLLLACPHRAYRRHSHKWQILSIGLSIFSDWLSSYTPNAADFPHPAKPSELNPPPGFHVAQQMHTKSDFIRLVLFVLDECVTYLDAYQPFQGKKHLEDCALHCLNLLENALEKERIFLKEYNASGTGSFLAIGASKLILGANPRTGKCDHLVNVAKFVTYPWLPRQSLAAVSVLSLVAVQPTASEQMLNVFTVNPAIKTDIRHGFVECLESEEFVAETENVSIIRKTKELILRLIHQCLGLAAPNISHYLLGFELKKDLSRSSLHQPGVGGFPRTCIHSLLYILDQYINTPNEIIVKLETNLIEVGYNLLYVLCAKPQTSSPTLRFLRLNSDFLVRHIKSLPSPGGCSSGVLRLRAALLRACACEAASRPPALTAALLTTSSEESSEMVPPDGLTGESSCRILTLLMDLETRVAVPEPPKWDFFDSQLLTAAIRGCDKLMPGGIGTYTGGRRIDIEELHSLLVRELSILQTTAPQRGLVAKEIEKVMAFAASVNWQRNKDAAIVRYYDAWRQLAGVLFCADAPSSQSRGPLLLVTLKSVLAWADPAEMLPWLGNLVSATVLLLTVNLRHSHLTEKRGLDPNSNQQTTAVTLQSNTLVLKFILQKILGWILISGGSTQTTRINLYGAFLNFLRIVTTDEDLPQMSDLSDTTLYNNTYVSQLDSSRIKQSRAKDSDTALKSMFIEVLEKYGGSLATAVAADSSGAAEGGAICRVAALASAAALLAAGPSALSPHLLHLQLLVDELLNDDAGLLQVLEANPTTMRPLYIYTSKVVLLTAVAGSSEGAAQAISQGVGGALSNLTALHYRPEHVVRRGDLSRTNFVPDQADRYTELLLPALSFFHATLTTLSCENLSAVEQVLFFLSSHADAMETILRTCSSNSSTGALKEAESVSGLVARTASPLQPSQEGFLEGPEPSVAISRLRRLSLALLARLALSDKILKELVAFAEDDDADQRVLLYFKIICNLLTFARRTSVGLSWVTFRPTLGTGIQATNPTTYNKKNDSQYSSPHIGVLVQQLVNAVSHHQREKLVLDMLKQRLRSVGEMPLLQLSEFAQSHPDGRTADTRTLAAQAIAARLRIKKTEMDHCIYSIENSVYLIWAHLDYYMLRAVPLNAGYDSFNFNQTSRPISSSEAVFKVSSTEISDLKNGLVGVFNDTFASQLIATAEDQPVAQKGFIDVLLRKIKRLLQFVPVD